MESVSERLRQIQEELRVATAEYKEVKGQLDSVEDKISDNTELLQKTEADLKVKTRSCSKECGIFILTVRLAMWMCFLEPRILLI